MRPGIGKHAALVTHFVPGRHLVTSYGIPACIRKLLETLEVTVLRCAFLISSRPPVLFLADKRFSV